ncbi:MAG: ATP-binding protein [Pseudomonadota bacterium]
MGSSPERLESVKPFKLVKFFSFSSFVAILVFSFILTSIISYRTRTVLLHKSEQYALLLAENLNHQVYLHFIIPTIRTHGYIKLREPEQFALLNTVVRNTIHSFRIGSVNIYDAAENVVSYSTETSMVGRRDVGGMAYNLALRGKYSSQLVSRGDSWSIWPGKWGEERELKTYIPFRHEKLLSWRTGPIMGVFEITQDISADYETISQFQYMIIMVSAVLMTVLFLVLRYIVARADRIIYARALEQRRLEEQLNQSERLASLGEMIAAVSHEIKNPLGIIQSTAEMLEKKVRSFDPQNRLASIIFAEANRLNRIVTEFLDFARPQTLSIGACNTCEIVDRNLSFLEPELEKAGISVERNFVGDDAVIEGDQDLLYRALLNIFVNAIQAMPDGGDLTIDLSYTDEKKENLQISIRDTGGGIPPDIAPKIFKPFFTTKHKGSGLGLAIVNNIIRQHDGVIRIESREGMGARFVIDLPVKQRRTAGG